MYDLLADVLHRRVRPSPDGATTPGAQFQIQISTTLPLGLMISSVSSDNDWHPELMMSGGHTESNVPLNANAGDKFVLTDISTNALVGAFSVPADGYPQGLVIDDSFMTEPNALSTPPQPTATTVIPQDSYPVLVGFGSPANNTYLKRLQFWHRTDESYSLAPGEEMEITTSTETGIQSTSSTSETVATALGISSSAGWGPVSVSVNASLNTDTTTQQSVTITETTATYITRKMTNPSATESLLVFHWAIVDRIVILQGPAWNIATIVGILDIASAPRVAQSSVDA